MKITKIYFLLSKSLELLRFMIKRRLFQDPIKRQSFRDLLLGTHPNVIIVGLEYWQVLGQEFLVISDFFGKLGFGSSFVCSKQVHFLQGGQVVSCKSGKVEELDAQFIETVGWSK